MENKLKILKDCVTSGKLSEVYVNKICQVPYHKDYFRCDIGYKIHMVNELVGGYAIHPCGGSSSYLIKTENIDFKKTLGKYYEEVIMNIKELAEKHLKEHAVILTLNFTDDSMVGSIENIQGKLHFKAINILDIQNSIELDFEDYKGMDNMKDYRFDILKVEKRYPLTVKPTQDGIKVSSGQEVLWERGE